MFLAGYLCAAGKSSPKSARHFQDCHRSEVKPTYRSLFLRRSPRFHVVVQQDEGMTPGARLRLSMAATVGPGPSAAEPRIRGV